MRGGVGSGVEDGKGGVNIANLDGWGESISRYTENLTFKICCTRYSEMKKGRVGG